MAVLGLSVYDFPHLAKWTTEILGRPAVQKRAYGHATTTTTTTLPSCCRKQGGSLQPNSIFGHSGYCIASQDTQDLAVRSELVPLKSKLVPQRCASADQYLHDPSCPSSSFAAKSVQAHHENAAETCCLDPALACANGVGL